MPRSHRLARCGRAGRGIWAWLVACAQAWAACLLNEGHILRGDAADCVSIAVGVEKGAPRGVRAVDGLKTGRADSAPLQGAQGHAREASAILRALLEDQPPHMMAALRERLNKLLDKRLDESMDDLFDQRMEELANNVRTSAYDDDRYDIVEVYRYGTEMPGPGGRATGQHGAAHSK